MFDVAPAFPNNPKDNDGGIKEADTAPFKIKDSVADVFDLSFCPWKSIEEVSSFSFHFAWDNFGSQTRWMTLKKPSTKKKCVKLLTSCL